MPLDQVISAVDSPRGPWSLVLAVVFNVVLLMATARAVPCVVVDGDADPWIVGRASSVTDGDTHGG
jgi:hypothetical protein